MESQSLLEEPKKNRRFIARLKRRRNKTIIYTLSFSIPFLFLMSAFAVQQVHPIGNKTVLTVDLYHQYAPFLDELREKLLTGESLFYSWNIGLGTNFWAIFANYEASPLNILVLFAPQKYTPDMIALIACIRAGLSGLFMCMLLLDTDKRKRQNSFLICFSVMYALCAWVLAYFWNIMWHDGVVLLPLIVLGLRKLMRDKKPFIYCISLFLCLWSNFFVGYFVCFFLILYAPICYITVYAKASLKTAWSSTWRFGIFSLLSGGASAILLYPTWMTLQHSSAVGDQFPKENYLTQNAFDFFSRFFLGGNPNIREGMANVYCGILIMIFIPLFFICKKVRMAEKVGYSVILAFLYFSMADRFLNFIWHGFHFPNQIPYRQAFLMSFLLIMMAYRVIQELRTFSMRDVGFCIVAVLVYIALYEQIGSGSEGTLAILLTAAFVAVYALVIHYFIEGTHSLYTRRFVLSITIFLEMFVSVQISIALLANNESFTNWEFYSKNDAYVASFLKEKEEEYGFVRAEVYPPYMSNQTALYHMKGMSVFSSTADQDYVKFMKSLGFHNNGINGTRNFGLTPVTSSLFGIRYMIDVNGNGFVADRVPRTYARPYEYGEEEKKIQIVENPNVLPFGYMVDEKILQFETPLQNTPFLNNNRLIHAMGIDRSIYLQRELEIGTLSNAVTESNGNAQNGYEFRPNSSDSAVTIQVRPTNYLEDENLYIYVQASKQVTVRVTPNLPNQTEKIEDLTASDETTMSSWSVDARTGQIIDIGCFPAGANPEVELYWSDGSGGNVTVTCYAMDEQAYGELIQELSAEPFLISSYSSSHLAGTVTAEEDGVLLLTMSKDPGWTAKVDGELTELSLIGNALIGIPLTAGSHTVHLSYIPEGLKEGALISLICILLLAAAFPINKMVASSKKSFWVKLVEKLSATEDEILQEDDEMMASDNENGLDLDVSDFADEEQTPDEMELRFGDPELIFGDTDETDTNKHE